MTVSDLSTIRGVYVTVDCSVCKGTGNVPGPMHKEYGEIVACPICKGSKLTSEIITLAQLRTLVTPR